MHTAVRKKLKALRSQTYIAKYTAYNTIKRAYALNTNTRKTRFIISLTSYPQRFARTFLSIESLLNQTFKADRIILWLAQEEIKHTPLPTTITKLTKRGLEIKTTKHNIKSYKKLIPTLQQFPDCNIITCDDDWIYPPWFLQGLQQSYQNHPDCISAYRCRMMYKLSERQLAPYQRWPFAINNQPSYNLFPTSGGGTLYPPNTLHQTTTDQLFLQLSPSADDIWLKAMSLLQKTKVAMVNQKSTDFYPINHRHSSSLWQTNVTANDTQIKQVFDYFDLYNQIS